MKHLFLLFVGVMSVAGGARGAEWTLDRAASRLDFAASFESNPAPGTFKEFDTKLRFDGTQPAGGHLDVVIGVVSADMQSSSINEAIAGPEWFDFKRFPRAEFHSTEIRSAGGDRYVARGTLELKGVQKPVEVPFSWSESSGTGRMDGEFKVKRGDFAIGTGQWTSTQVIGADVTIKYTVRLRKVG